MLRVQHKNIKNSVTLHIYPRYPPLRPNGNRDSAKISTLITLLNPLRIFTFANAGIIFLNFVVLDSFMA